jgi:hypothetical protein
LKSQDEIFALCDQIRETSFSLHRYLRHGHLEKVYENGLTHRLQKAGLHVKQQHPIKVFTSNKKVCLIGYLNKILRLLRPFAAGYKKAQKSVNLQLKLLIEMG